MGNKRSPFEQHFSLAGGLPLGWCSSDIKDLLHDVDGLMMMIMDGGGGGHYDRWRVANSLRVPLPGQ